MVLSDCLPMNFRFTVVDSSLNRAEFRWKWLRFLKHSFVLGIILCGGFLLLGAAILSGHLTNRSMATVLLILLAICGFVAWAALILWCFWRSGEAMRACTRLPCGLPGKLMGY